MWNATTLEHIGSHPFGIYRGSLTWIDQDSTGTWYGTFANYDRVQSGQMLPYGLTMRTQLVQFGEDWTVTRSWIYPDALWQSFSPMSNSGESFGTDGWLYITVGVGKLMCEVKCADRYVNRDTMLPQRMF